MWIFGNSKKKQAIIDYLRENGGFENMYHEIIQGLKDDIHGEIVEKTEYSVTISNQLYEVGETKYYFEQLHAGQIKIQYDKPRIKIFNEDAVKRHWTFNDKTDPRQILAKIKYDLGLAVFGL